jgi:DNA-binding beta-propeller fold protein YncE
MRMHAVTKGSRASVVLAALLVPALVAGCGDEGAHQHPGGGHEHEDALFVAHAGVLVSYALESGEERPGEIQDVAGPVDLQALDDGRVLVNLSARNEVLVVDGKTMLELARIPSSALGAVNPVHSYISPARDGRQYWVAFNDGDGTAGSDSAAFIDISRGSSTLHERVGETALGVGHHKAAFSTTRERIVVSNIGDCDDVISVFDYSDVDHIERIATLSAEDAGWDGSSFATTCDPTYEAGVPVAPHGCASSAESGKVYCNLTGSGRIAAVDVDADPPTFSFIPTSGAGGGYTRSSAGGRYVYSLQGEPREGSAFLPGETCQIGQLAVIHATSDTVVSEVPLFYDGPDCERSLADTDEATSEPAHIVIHEDRMFVTLAGGYGVDDARVRRQIVLDMSDRARPVQLPSLAIGTSTSYHGDALSGDGTRLFVANNLDATITEIDCETHEVVRTLGVRNRPSALATYQEHEGPGHQTGPIE